MAAPASMRSVACPCFRSHARTSSPGLVYGMPHWHRMVWRKSMSAGRAVRMALAASISLRWRGVTFGAGRESGTGRLYGR
ncbi:hypothetical protein ETAA1_38530 [Urbifossiella limnaea]|uniref:Uncharacterized protein n=1 Tax=Urbifossiella limnaea TaxID=2528023 RepID=A0A517XWJ7_9BACT|nr:hypothetical protein ETAA1_38530 [Urbifossiella limnaea]